MNTGAKITLAIGGIIVLLGVITIVMAGPSAKQYYVNPSDEVQWRTDSTTNETIPLSDETYELFVKNGAEYHNLSITDSSGNELFLGEHCEEYDGEEASCEYEWIEIGYFDAYDCPCKITVNSTEDIIFTVYGEAGEKTDVDGYFMSFCGGIIAILSGIVLLAVGGGISLFSKKTNVNIAPAIQQQYPPQ
ncbi:MAG: hypothetical protein HOE69_05310 [Euryarchaeota archaeon]|jgi:hypothetical protein|nr:hypothetical protein [Euryarchaeota archaeon]